MATAPTTVLIEAIDEAKAHDDFTSLSADGRLLILAAVLAYGREMLLTGDSAADHAERLITAGTGSSRLGDATARAVRMWAARAD